MAADTPYGEFYDFYSVSPEYYGFYPYVCARFWKNKKGLRERVVMK
jgi:hypothetical protein